MNREPEAYETAGLFLHGCGCFVLVIFLLLLCVICFNIDLFIRTIYLWRA